MEFHRILLPTDLSSPARNAYEYSAYLARRFKATITLFHVDDTVSYGFSTSRALVAYLEATGQRIATCLVDEANKLRTLGAEVKVASTAGVPSREISNAIEAVGYDLVIMTRHGARAQEPEPTGPFLGKTAKKLLRSLKVPLLLVPNTEPEDFQGFQRILTTTDFSSDSDLGLMHSRGFTKRLGSQLTVLHVLETPRPIAPIAGEPPIHLPKELLAGLKEAKQEALGKLCESDPNLDSMVTINSDAADGILDVADALDSDLIVIPSHGKGTFRALLFGSTTENLLKRTSRPVLILPRTFLRDSGNE